MLNWEIHLDGLTNIPNTFTDAQGNFSFVNIPTGLYVVSEVPQSGWTQTVPVSPNTYTVDLTGGQNVTGLIFGNKSDNGTIIGMVFNDVDNDGFKDGNEWGLNNWEVHLTGTANKTAFSDGNGYYYFTELPIGTYTVSEVVQTYWTQTVPVSPNTYSVTFSSPGGFSSGNDFGNHLAGTSIIQGIKFHDLTTSGTLGVKDGSDPGIAGWTIRLSKTTDSVFMTTTTNTNGEYTFGNLSSGIYTVYEVQQNGWTQTFPPDGGNALNGVYTIEVTGQTISNIDFGNKQNPPPTPFGAISGLKFEDVNGNGIRDGQNVWINDSLLFQYTDPPIQNWTIQVVGPSPLTTITTTTTSSNGTYLFSNLPVGTYTVSEGEQSGWAQTYPSSGTYTVTINTNQNATGNDFGNHQFPTSSNFVTITGKLFLGTVNNDCVQDIGETNLENWFVQISSSSPAYQAVALTNSDGEYTFQVTQAGTYTVNASVKQYYTQSCPPSPSIYTETVTSNDVTNNLVIPDRNFAMSAPVSPVIDLGITAGSGTMRPGFTVPLGISYTNTGTDINPANATITFVHPVNTFFLPSTAQPPVTSYNSTTRIATWDISGIPAGAVGNIFAYIAVAAPPTIQLGTTLQFTASIALTSSGTDVNSSNDITTVPLRKLEGATSSYRMHSSSEKIQNRFETVSSFLFILRQTNTTQDESRKNYIFTNHGLRS